MILYRQFMKNYDSMLFIKSSYKILKAGIKHMRFDERQQVLYEKEFLIN